MGTDDGPHEVDVCDEQVLDLGPMDEPVHQCLSVVEQRGCRIAARLERERQPRRRGARCESQLLVADERLYERLEALMLGTSRHSYMTYSGTGVSARTSLGDISLPPFFVSSSKKSLKPAWTCAGLFFTR